MKEFSPVVFLQKLISTPSYSREEKGVCQLFINLFEERSIPFERVKNNIWTKNKYFDPQKPSILLNSHYDTVKPNAGYTKNPFEPEVV